MKKREMGETTQQKAKKLEMVQKLEKQLERQKQVWKALDNPSSDQLMEHFMEVK